MIRSRLVYFVFESLSLEISISIFKKTICRNRCGNEIFISCFSLEKECFHHSNRLANVLLSIFSLAFCLIDRLTSACFREKLQEPNSKNVEKTEDSVEQDVDSSGESVYWSAMEFDEDCDTMFNGAIGCPSGSPG